MELIIFFSIQSSSDGKTNDEDWFGFDATDGIADRQANATDW